MMKRLVFATMLVSWTLLIVTGVSKADKAALTPASDKPAANAAKPEEAKPEIAPADAPAEIPAESPADPFAIPEDASAEELLVFIQGLSKTKPASMKIKDRLEHVRKMTGATIGAADKILAGEADGKTRLAAVDAQIAAYSSLQRINDRQAPERLAALADKFKEDATPEIAARARWIPYQLRGYKVMQGNAADALPLLTELPAVVAGSPDPMVPAQIAMSALPMLETSGTTGPAAIQVYRDLADALVKTDSPMGKRAAGLVQSVIRKLELIGKPITLNGTLLAGEALDQSSVKGKVVLVDFWATWCGPCLGELPNVQECYKKYHDKGFEVVGISLDNDRKQLEKFIKDREIPWPILFEKEAKDQGWKNPIARSYGVSGIPAMFILDADGNVISLSARGKRLSEILEKQLGAVEPTRTEPEATPREEKPAT